jgi:Flp pilus assembly protein TadG
MFAIMEVALVFFAGQILETATADSARRIMTGQVQKAGFDAQEFKDDLCGRLHAMFNCGSGVHIDVRKYDAFSGANISPPAYDEEEDELDLSDFQQFQPGVQGDIVVVRVVYEWPMLVRDLGFNLATLPNGNRLLMATAAFRNEPYKN